MIHPDIKDIMLPGKVKRFLLVHPASLKMFYHIEGVKKV